MSAVTNNDGVRQDHKFPEIFLDTTLAELLAEEPENKGSESLCNFKPCSDPRHQALPLNKKYLITSKPIDDESILAHLQLENVSYLLSFWAGQMEVPLLACEGWTKDDSLSSDRMDHNALKGFSVLNEKQRPRPKAFANKDQFVQHYKNDKTPVRWGFAVDFAEQIPYAISPELHYKLNSKRWLAECSLLSANDRIIDPTCSCAKHTTDSGLWYYDSECSDCKDEVEKDVSHLKDKLQDTKLPFVLKLTQSLGSVGTMLVKTEEDRDTAIKRVTKFQSETLRFVNAINAHIYPSSLVLSDFLPGDTHALNFYIRRDASVRFLGACQQLSTSITGGRQHTALTWDQQEKLEKKFKDKLNEIGKVLHQEGYFGPCGADIMETEDETQYVIDLNVRTSTSTILGCLRGHCEKHGFNVCAVYECLLLTVSREDLEDKFRKEFQEGRFILLGTTRLGDKNIWAYPVVIAGEDIDTMKALGQRTLKFESGGDGEAGGG